MKRLVVLGSAALLTATAFVASGGTAFAAQTHGKPVVTAVASNYGATTGFTHVIITGRRLTGTRRVTFGGTRAARVHVLSSHKVVAYAPGHHHGTVQVRVRTKAGTSATSHRDRYTYVHQTEPGTWHARTAPVPSGATADDFVNAVSSCPTTTVCYSVGIFGPAKYGIYSPNEKAARKGGALVSTRVSGRITTQRIALPPDVAPGDTSINFISCPAVGSCAAVGDTDGNGHGVRLVLAHGAWTASDASLPVGGVISGLSCPAPGECTAIGYHVASSNNTGPVLLRLHDGTWTTTHVVPPGGHSVDAELSGLDCASASYCLASGSYKDRHSSGAFVVQVRNGVQTVRRIPNSPRAGRSVSTDAVQCPAVARCTVLGEFTAGPHDNAAFVSVTDGHTFTIHPITPPADADRGYALDAWAPPTMSCPAVSVCYVEGEYYFSPKALFLDSVVRLDGTTVHLFALPQPAGKPGASLTVTDIDCASRGACTAVGAATDSHSGNTTGAYFTFADGVWTTEASQKAHGQRSGPTVTTYNAVECPAAGSCVANGDYAWDPKPDPGSDGFLLYRKASGLVSIETPN